MLRSTYPFTAIVGQEKMKEALILNAVLPSIGGVLIKGEKGTAKSTAVRAIADILPERHCNEGCACGCEWGSPNMCPECEARAERGELRETVRPMEVVELPLSSTEDRVVGTLDIESAITTGRKNFEPGILARANGNILYVDEVNLLDDHIVDVLLDAAAMGRNYIEREGVSYTHPSRFILVGTMNPEEGDLRPQLLDRFGFTVEVEAEHDPEKRTEIVMNRMAFEKDPEGFCADCAKEQDELRRRIARAKEIVNTIEPSRDVVRAAVRIPLHLGVDGHRSDITLVKAAVAHAAFQGRTDVRVSDVVHVTELVMTHRMRRDPFQESSLDREELSRWLTDEFGES